jgi:hypothetical protein
MVRIAGEVGGDVFIWAKSSLEA